MERQVLELEACGKRVDSTLPYDALHVNAWHRRTRAVYPAPPCILHTYPTLASKVFATLARGNAQPNAQTDDVVAVGDLGLGFALDPSYVPVVSVEATALYQLVTQTAGASEETPAWLQKLQGEWTAGMALVLFCKATGWRGAFAEHRLWSCILLREGGAVRTPYAKAVVRGWFPPAILADLDACVGKNKVAKVASAIAEMGFEGAPDLCLWRRNELWLVECKSANDQVKEVQRRMIQRLWKLGVRCQLCAPKSALKRLLEVALVSDDDSS